jgi:hypothetical protein
VKPQPGDISIVDKTGTFLLWYDIARFLVLTVDSLVAYAARISRYVTGFLP